jgi:hypothetical protein
MSEQPGALPQRLRAALPAAMRAGDRVFVSALRSAIAALDNATAVPIDGTPSAGAYELAAHGPGSADVARRELDELEVAGVLRTEIEDRLSSAVDLEGHGQREAAKRLRAEAAALETFLA